jgi:hypothetical protein
MRSKAVILTLSAVMMGVILCGFASAQVLMVTSRPGLGATDMVDWSQFGNSYTNVPDPSNFTSTGGLTGTIADSLNSQMQIRQQGNSWAGNFTQGDYVLLDETSGGLLSISFNTPVSAAGANIQANLYGSFNASISAYDSSNNLLGSFTESGNSTSSSAIFLGVSSSINNISKLEYGIPSNESAGFGINQLGIRANPSTNVPEPGDLALLLSGGLSGLALFLKRSLIRTA